MIRIPACPNCEEECQPCGSTLDGKRQLWHCSDCGLDIEDTDAQKIEQELREISNPWIVFLKENPINWSGARR